MTVDPGVAIGRVPDGARQAVRAAVLCAVLAAVPPPSAAQVPVEGEVRQLVTFRFLPGRAGEARAIFRERALPLYEANPAMLSFRGFREVESPVPLDLIVVSAFEGMAGMDASNEALAELASRAGTGIGSIYGDIAALAATHDDQFVAMRPALSWGDPSSKRLAAFISYRIAPGERARFERVVERRLLPREREAGIPSATGRFLVADGWDYLRVLGFDTLGGYQAYLQDVEYGAIDPLGPITAARRVAIVAPVDELRVR